MMMMMKAMTKYNHDIMHSCFHGFFFLDVLVLLPLALLVFVS